MADSTPRRSSLRTTEQFSYQRANGQKILDLTHFKDRENRWTLSGYDALRQRIASVDPLNRLTRFHGCYCGALQDLWDAEGKKTHWDYDFTGRLKCSPAWESTSTIKTSATGRCSPPTDSRSSTGKSNTNIGEPITDRLTKLRSIIRNNLVENAKLGQDEAGGQTMTAMNPP